MRKKYTSEDRERFLDELRKGNSVSEVAKRLGVSAATAYLWAKRLRTQETPTFARLKSTQQPATPMMPVQIGAATIHVEPGFDAELLRAVVLSLSKVSS